MIGKEGMDDSRSSAAPNRYNTSFQLVPSRDLDLFQRESVTGPEFEVLTCCVAGRIENGLSSKLIGGAEPPRSGGLKSREFPGGKFVGLTLG